MNNIYKFDLKHHLLPKLDGKISKTPYYIVYMKRTNFQGVDAFLLILGVFELLVIAKVSDLPIGIINWFPKAHEISKLAIPSSNFYPAGSALMLTPFLFLESKPLLIIVFYFSLANFFSLKIPKLLNQKN